MAPNEQEGPGCGYPGFLPGLYAPDLIQYGRQWLAHAFMQDWWNKLAVWAFIMVASEVELLWKPVLVAIIIWFCDWFLGAGRALLDPETPFKKAKAARAWFKPMVIITVAIMARALETILILSLNYDPAGKFVLLVCLFMLWEDADSARDNLRYWYKNAGLQSILNTMRRMLGSKAPPEPTEEDHADADVEGKGQQR